MTKPLPFTMVGSCLAFVIFGVAAGPMAIQASAALPSSVASRVKQINSALDAVDQALAADRLTTAQRKLGDAQRIFKELQDRYAGKFEEDDPDYKAMTERLAVTASKVKSAEQAAADASAADAQAQAANVALCKQWIEKLSPYLDHASDQYLRIGAELNSASPDDQAKSKAAYARCKVLFEEYQKVEFPLGKSTELANVESSLTSTMKYYGREEADAEMEAACKPWVDKLAPFVDVGMSSPQYLIASPTLNSEQLKKQEALYEEAGKLFAEYQTAQFPKGKSRRLEQLESQMKETLSAFPEAAAQSRAMMSGDVGKQLEGVLAYLNGDTAWQTDAKKKLPTIMARDLEPLREAVERYAGSVAADDAKLVEHRAMLKAIETKDAEHRVIWAKRTFQAPDGFAGADLKTLKAKAEQVAVEAHPKATVLRVTVPSDDWAVEDVVEAADTTRTALRRRITRSVRAQVALKEPDGGVWLQEVYLGQDRQPDGSWAPLKGHTTWADRMAPENVGKTGP